MQKTYLVMGQSGSFDDYRTWPVQAYDDPEKAARHCAAAQAWAVKVETLFTARGDEYGSALRQSGLKNPFDAEYSFDDAGVGYLVRELPPRVESIDLSLVENFALTAPTREFLEQICPDLLELRSGEDDEATIRFLMLSQCVDPEGLIEGQPAWQVIAGWLPAKEAPPKPATLDDIWGKGIPAMPGTEGGSLD